MTSERLLDPKSIRVHQSEDQKLILTKDDRSEPIDQIVRCFPFSTPNNWISFRKADGTEIGLLKTTTDLPDPSRHLVETHLKDRYHIPTILSITQIEASTNGTEWQVETEEGPRTFSLRGERGINTSDFPQISLTDANTRQRFVIPDYAQLDRSSQHMARAHLPSSRGRGGRGGRPRF